MSEKIKNNPAAEIAKLPLAFLKSHSRNAVLKIIRKNNPPLLVARLLAEVEVGANLSRSCGKLQISLDNFEPKIAKAIKKFASSESVEVNSGESPPPRWLDENFAKDLKKSWDKRSRNRVF